MKYITSSDSNNNFSVKRGSRYQDITSQMMIKVLKAGLRDFDLSCGVEVASQLYEKETMDLVEEYISKLEKIMPDAGVVRCANRGLEALFSIRDDEALKHSNNIWGDENIEYFEEKLIEDSLNNAISEMYNNVHILIGEANFEELWRNMNFSSKKELLNAWGMTMGEDESDKLLETIYYTRRELISFEDVMGREFEEFDQYLRP